MAEHERRSDGHVAPEDEYSGYTVRDRNGGKIGKVDDLFLDGDDRPEYIGVKMGFLGTRSTLIPMDLCTVDGERGFIDVSADNETVKNGPAFDEDREITLEYEREVRSHYGLQTVGTNPPRGSYGDYYRDDEAEEDGSGATRSVHADEGRADGQREESGTVGPGMRMGDTESGEFRGHGREEEGVDQPGSDLEDEDELRVQRSEEEVVTDKRTVAKEEVRVRKDVVEDTEVVEDDVRREEIDVEDATERRKG